MIGFYEAPDGENEALFIADKINRFLRDADGDEGQRTAVLYRTNSQSRLVEEALRRYGIKYTMVGGFSFYERAEIRDLLSYLKLVQNPDDSVALQRAVNTPPRGIGKTTLETLERIALETGVSTWSAIGSAIAGIRILLGSLRRIWLASLSRFWRRLRTIRLRLGRISASILGLPRKLGTRYWRMRLLRTTRWTRLSILAGRRRCRRLASMWLRCRLFRLAVPA
jgi:hypothetical protein